MDQFCDPWFGSLACYLHFLYEHTEKRVISGSVNFCSFCGSRLRFSCLCGMSLSQVTCETISIFHGCMVWIEKSVTRVTDRHYEACRVMPNSDPK